MTQKADLPEQQAVIIAEHTDMAAVMARFDQLDSKIDQLDSKLTGKIDLLRSDLTRNLTRRITLMVTVPLYLALAVVIMALVVNAL